MALSRPPRVSAPTRRVSERPPHRAAAARARFLPEVLLAVLLAGGCQPASRTVEASETASLAATAAFVSDGFGERNTDLRLLGQESTRRDVVFEGRAAVDLQQHTAVSEGADFDPDVDPSGKHLVFSSTRHSAHGHIYVKSVDGAVLTQLTDEPANDVQPEYSPDGARIAFASDRAGQWDIWVFEANGRHPIQITDTPAAELHPSWSPDGERLVYCRIDPRDQRGELWIVELAHPGVKRLIGEGLFPEWSPRGDKIVYQRARARGRRAYSIWTLDIANNEVLYPTEVASSSQFALIAPTWSPDGTQIAFAAVPAREGKEPAGRSPYDRTNIAIIDADGRALQRLTETGGENHSPTWSADGRIFFTVKFENHETIWSVKPFRPPVLIEPPPAPGDRRAAAMESEIDP